MSHLLGSKAKGGDLFVFADASPQRHATGLAAVYRNGEGALLGWRMRVVEVMTSCQAEYAAVSLALTQAVPFAPSQLIVFSDSKVVVEQLSGVIAVRHDGLRPFYEQAKAHIEKLENVRLVHVPRELNVIADALAEDAVGKLFRQARRRV